MFSFSVLCDESPSSDDFSESSDDLSDVSVKDNGDAEIGEETEEREQAEDQFEEADEVMGQEQYLDVEGELGLNMQQDDELLDMEEEPYVDITQDHQHQDMEQDVDMEDGQYQQTPPGILNFRMFTALPKHNTRNITSIIIISIQG